MGSFTCKASGAKFTLVGFLPGMNVFVIIQVIFSDKSFAANITFVLLLVIGSMYRVSMPFHQSSGYQFTALIARYFFMNFLDVIFQT
jgi:hypothetical protein